MHQVSWEGSYFFVLRKKRSQSYIVFMSSQIEVAWESQCTEPKSRSREFVLCWTVHWKSWSTLIPSGMASNELLTTRPKSGISINMTRLSHNPPKPLKMSNQSVSYSTDDTEPLRNLITDLIIQLERRLFSRRRRGYNQNILTNTTKPSQRSTFFFFLETNP